MKTVIILILLPFVAIAKINVVTTLSDYAVIAKAIGENKIEVSSIVHPDADPHHVRPKPSYALLIKRADLFITTGLDLELWVPSLLNRAANPRVRSGQIGYVSAAAGIPLIEKPTNLSHSEGGLHLYGNPHITTSPINMLYVAKNIATGLIKVDPSNKSFYEKRHAKYRTDLINKIFGKKLPKFFGEDVAVKLGESGTLYDFLEKKNMMNLLGGWFYKARALKNHKIVSYHKNWGYLIKILNIENVECIEVKPGVPPTPSHVLTVIRKMKNESVKTIVGANYFSESKMRNVASRVGANLAILRMGLSTDKRDVMDKFDIWVAQIKKTL